MVRRDTGQELLGVREQPFARAIDADEVVELEGKRRRDRDQCAEPASRVPTKRLGVSKHRGFRRVADVPPEQAFREFQDAIDSRAAFGAGHGAGL